MRSVVESFFQIVKDRQGSLQDIFPSLRARAPPPLLFDRPAALAARSAARAAVSGGGSVLARPPSSQQQLRHNRCALWPWSGRLARPTIPRPASFLEIAAEDACTGNVRASGRRGAWRKRKPHRLCAAPQD